MFHVQSANGALTGAGTAARLRADRHGDGLAACWDARSAEQQAADEVSAPLRRRASRRLNDRNHRTSEARRAPYWVR